MIGRGRWPIIESTLLREACTLPAASATLRRNELNDVATALEERRLITWAEEQVRLGRTLTIGDDAYPTRWRRGRAPLALWRSGDVSPARFAAIVGTREPTPTHLAFAQRSAMEIAREGRQVISGGTVGVDTIAADAASSPLVILPYGIDRCDASYAAISACAPWESFSTASAMERNTLIYLAADYAVAIGARVGQGGTWQGAVQAIRRRLTEVRVPDDGSPGSCALIALGARPISNLPKVDQTKNTGDDPNALPLDRAGAGCVFPLTGYEYNTNIAAASTIFTRLD